jgi:hypothetical protein
MRLIRSLIRTLRHRLRAEEGVVMLYALAATVIILASSAAAFAAINDDLPLGTADSSEKQAYAAAQAGIQRYLFELNENSEFWTECGQGANWIFSPGQTVTPVAVPGSSTETYAVTMLPAAGQLTYRKCSTTDPVDSMVQATGEDAGSFRISSTGSSGGLSRTIVANFREQSFLDYTWFTDYETADPSLQVSENAAGDPTLQSPSECASESSPPSGCGTNYDKALAGAETQCSQYRYAGRGTDNLAGYGAGNFFKDSGDQCQNIEFITGDHINGPFHSNDSVLICGTPSFGTSANDRVEFGGPSPGWVGAGCGNDRPTIDGNANGQAVQSSILNIPQTNTLGPIAGLAYTGTTCLNLQSNGIEVAQPGHGANASNPSCFSRNLSWSQPVSYPSNGVLYVSNSTTNACSLTYDVDDPSYTGNNGCGTVYVSGQDAEPLTIGSDNDIVIDGNLTYPTPNASGAMLGLIATNFVRVYHPVGSQPLTANTSACDANTPNATGSLPNLTIDAMMLSLQHSFIVDQYNCGGALGTLTVNGGIAQKYRGTVGTSGGGSTGYLKNYNYDNRLRYEEPPHFLTPVEGAWDIERETECAKVSICDATSS